jgi:Tfp pilus assembly protein PilO
MLGMLENLTPYRVSNYVRSMRCINSEKGNIDTIVGIILIGLLCFGAFYYYFYIPNQKSVRDLQKRLNLTQIELAEKKAIADNLPKFQEEIARLDQETLKMSSSYPSTVEDFQKKFDQFFHEKGFSLQDYNQEPKIPPLSQWWDSYQLDFTLTGPKNTATKSLLDWRNQNLPSTKFQKIFITPGTGKNNVKMRIEMVAHVLIPKEEALKRQETLKLAPHPSRTQLPEISDVKGRKAKRLLRDIQLNQAEIDRLQTVIGEVGKFKHAKSRLDNLQKQDREFSESLKSELEILNSQLPTKIKSMTNSKEVSIFFEGNKDP